MQLLDMGALEKVLCTGLPRNIYLRNVGIHHHLSFREGSDGYIENKLDEEERFGNFELRSLGTGHGVQADQFHINIKFPESIGQLIGSNYYADIYPFTVIEPYLAQEKKDSIVLYSPSFQEGWGKVIAIGWYPESRAISSSQQR